MSAKGPWKRFRLRRLARAGVGVAAGAKAPSGLPEFARKAHDLEALKKSVDDAAAVGGGLWLSYLLALFYLMVAAGSVTHADLFFEKPINLLLLNVQLPIVAFFGLAPLLFLALHAYTLAHLAMLTEKAKRFHAALYEQIGETAGMSQDDIGKRKRIRDGLRGQLPSNVFVQFLAGPPEMRGGGFGWALRAIGWTTLALAPALLFLLFQVQFLPYHHEAITWLHRGALVVDLALVWWLWRRILRGRDASEGRATWRRWAGWLWTPVGAAASLAAVAFAFGLAIYRGERLGVALEELDRSGRWALLHDRVFRSDVDLGTGRRRWLLSDALVLPRLNAPGYLKVDDPERLKTKDFIFIAQNRDLAGAEFQRAALAWIDFSGSILAGADFSEAQMDHVSLDGVVAQEAVLQGAHLREASLKFAQLQGASLEQAQLQNGRLDRTNLQGAVLDFAQLEGTSADIVPSLMGASMKVVQLVGANLRSADMRAADLTGAQLQGGNFEYARFDASLLDKSDAEGADLYSSNFGAADLSSAQMWRADGHFVKDERLYANPLPDWTGPQKPKAINGLLVLRNGRYEAFKFHQEFPELQERIKALPDGERKEETLERLKRLDCTEPSRSGCNQNDKSEARGGDPESFRGSIAIARISEAKAYQIELAKGLRDLVCSDVEEPASDGFIGAGLFSSLPPSVYTVRGRGFQQRIQAAGAAARQLIADLSDTKGKTCPIARQLTDRDRAALQEIARKF